jgi:hypothetical protein
MGPRCCKPTTPNAGSAFFASRAGKSSSSLQDVKFQAAAILEAALLPQGLKLVVVLCWLLGPMTRFGLMRCPGPLLVLRLLLGFFIEYDAPAGFVFLHGTPPVGNNAKSGVGFDGNPLDFPCCAMLGSLPGSVDGVVLAASPITGGKVRKHHSSHSNM